MKPQSKSAHKRKIDDYRRKVVSPFMSKLYAYLKDRFETVEMKKLKCVQGWYGRKEDTIEIDYRKQFLPTLIHEVLHHYYPEWSETRVLKEESKITNALSLHQVENIFIRYGKCLEAARKYRQLS